MDPANDANETPEAFESGNGESPPELPPVAFKHRPFRSAVMRGFGVFLTPLLTIVIMLWILGTVRVYVFEPLESGARNVVAFFMAKNNVYYDPRLTEEIEVIDGERYRRMSDDAYVPETVYAVVKQQDGEALADRETGRGMYRRYVQLKYLNGWVVVPTFLIVVIPLFYLLGRFVAVGLGGYVWDAFERLIKRVPLVRNVYTSVRQVTDFMFNQRDIQYTRVVAVEYPRKATWSLGFVTGESLLEIREAAAEPILAVLIPTSPMPVTGFTVTVLKSETLDLNLTIDQALEYIVSCGVVVPPHQLQSKLDERGTQRFPGQRAQRNHADSANDRASAPPASASPPDSAARGDAGLSQPSGDS